MILVGQLYVHVDKAYRDRLRNVEDCSSEVPAIIYSHFIPQGDGTTHRDQTIAKGVAMCYLRSVSLSRL